MQRAWGVAAMAAAALAFPAGAHAAKNVYVSGSGTGLNTCLSAGQACTLSKAVSVAVNGDTVLVEGGAGPVVTTGQVIAESISVRALDPAAPKPVITGNVASPDAVLQFAAGSDDANLSGLEVRNTHVATNAVGVLLQAPGVVVQDSVLSADGIAVVSANAPVTIRRVIARGGLSGAQLSGPSATPATIANSLLTASAPTGVALLNPSMEAGLTAVNVTAIASGADGVGVKAAGSIINPLLGGSIVLRNSIARGGKADLEAEAPSICALPPCAPGTIAVDHSDFTTKSGSPTEGAGNTSADPLFVSATDFHLQAGSPLRDVGVEDPLSQPVDLEGAPRKDGTGVDLGAYEYLIPLPPKNPLPPVDPAAVPKDTTAPALGVLRFSRPSFRVGPKATALSAARRRARVPAGTTITTGVTERSTVLFEIDRIITGRKSAGDCVKVKAKVLRRLKARQRCKLALPVEPGLERVAAKPGRLTFAFSGRVGSQALPAGPYRMIAIATDTAGNRSAPQRASFTIVAAKKQKKQRAR